MTEEAIEKKQILPDINEVRAEYEKLRYRQQYLRALQRTLTMLLAAAAAATLVATLWMPVLRIYGTSMEPTLCSGQFVAAWRMEDYSTGDIVVFRLGSKLLVKRCIAGPGDWVSIDEEGNVTVNDRLLEEPYLEQKALGECDISFPYQVPDGQWFLLGDNRAESIDSRSSSVGCISSDRILGRIFLRFWPLGKLGGV